LSPSRLVVGLAVGPRDLARDRPQHSPQRLGVDAVGFHYRSGERIVEKVMDGGFAVGGLHLSPLKPSTEINISVDKARRGVTSK
jgi:hypothetical protein